MDSVELLVLTLAAACVAMTFYLRKELDRHGFNMWVFAGVPMFALAIIAFVLWQELPSDFYEDLFFSLSALALAVEFIGTFFAVRKGRR
jgi:O-antigen/teichoic acid export membrane protein